MQKYTIRIMILWLILFYTIAPRPDNCYNFLLTKQQNPEKFTVYSASLMRRGSATFVLFQQTTAYRSR